MRIKANNFGSPGDSCKSLVLGFKNNIIHPFIGSDPTKARKPNSDERLTYFSTDEEELLILYFLFPGRAIATPI